MGPTYAIAEKAADMIKANATQLRVPNANFSGSSTTRQVPLVGTILFSLAGSVLAMAL